MAVILLDKGNKPLYVTYKDGFKGDFIIQMH